MRKTLNLQDIILQPIEPAEQVHFQSLLDEHHYLGSLPKIGHTLRYVVSYHGKWLALLSFSAAARKCAARDHWIGWTFRYQYDRLHLIANNSRFLILPEHHYPNLASRILSLCERRIAMDWQTHFGYPLLLLETFVDPRYFHGTIYRAANWLPVGKTRGFRRTREGYSNTAQHPKLVFLRPLQSFTQMFCLSQFSPLTISMELLKLCYLPIICECYLPILPKSLIHAVNRGNVILYLVYWLFPAAVLCGMEGYKAISDWANDLGQKARARLGCRHRHRHYSVPGRTTIRDLLTRVDPDQLDLALCNWNAQFGHTDEGLAIDGKTMRHAFDEQGRQTHILGVVGHQSKQCYTQKKSALCR